MSGVRVRLNVNGDGHELDAVPGESLAAVLRASNGVRVDCSDGTCGACTVLVDGDAVRSCLMWAVQCDGADVRTAEGL